MILIEFMIGYLLALFFIGLPSELISEYASIARKYPDIKDPNKDMNYGNRHH